MRQNLEKTALLKRILAFLAQYIPLNQALVASLGGEGREANVWRAAGIVPDNAHLIDRNPRKMHRLIKEQEGFRRCLSQLSHFPEVFRTQRGLNIGLDLFHADLCGTLEHYQDEVSPVLPLLAPGRGRCLAITVADSRRNLAQENPGRTLGLAGHSFGADHADKLWQHLLNLHTQIRIQYPATVADPEKVALRELGFLIKLQEMLCQGEGNLLPDRLESCIYASLGFRMRTYLLHLEVRVTPVSPWKMVHRLLQLAHRAPCFYLINEDAQLIVMEEKKMKEKKMTEDKKGINQQIENLYLYLEPLLVINPAIKETLDELVKRGLAQSNPEANAEVIRLRRDLIKRDTFIQQVHEGLQKLFSERRPEPAPAAPQPPPDKDAAPTPTPLLDALIAQTLAAAAKAKGHHELDLLSCDALRVHISRETAKGAKAEKAVLKAVAHLFGMDPKSPQRNRSFASFMAHTKGKLQKGFIVRLVKTHPDQNGALINELKTVYGDGPVDAAYGF